MSPPSFLTCIYFCSLFLFFKVFQRFINFIVFLEDQSFVSQIFFHYFPMFNLDFCSYLYYFFSFSCFGFTFLCPRGRCIQIYIKVISDMLGIKSAILLLFYVCFLQFLFSVVLSCLLMSYWNLFQDSILMYLSHLCMYLFVQFSQQLPCAL